MRWTSEEVAAATGGTIAGATQEPLAGVGIDSRVLPPGALFVAIRAGRDGHDYLASALERGARGLMVDDASAVASHRATFPVAVITVEDTAEALLALGRAARERL